jgi:lipoate-protein ligase A
MPAPPAGWRLVTPDAQPVADALAVSQRLLDGGDCPALVVHRVSPPAITCGRAQMGDIDMQAARGAGIEVLPRASGGGPVLWDDDLIAIDVVLPTGHPLLPTDVVAAYRWVGEAVATALRALGMPGARAVPPDEARSWGDAGPASSLCFGGMSPWEVVSGHRKVLGLSQVRRQAGAIIQAGVPMRLDAHRLARAVGAPMDAPAHLTDFAAGIAQLGVRASRGQVEAALVAALQAVGSPAGASTTGRMPGTRD